MKQLLMAITLVLSSLAVSAQTAMPTQGPLADAMIQAYNDYADRGAWINRGSIEIERILYIGHQISDASTDVYTAYMTHTVGTQKYYQAIQFTVVNGAIDPFAGVFSISATMIRDQDGNDLRFPQKLNEAEFSLLRQEAFAAAQKILLEKFPESRLTTFNIDTNDGNPERREKIYLRVLAGVISEDGRNVRAEQVTVGLNPTTGKILFTKFGY